MEGFVCRLLQRSYAAGGGITPPVVHRHKAAVLVADLSGFTKFTETIARDEQNGTEKLMEILNRIFAIVISCVYGEGGDILKFAGDAFLAVFPYDTDDGLECESMSEAICSALSAGLALQSKLGSSQVGEVQLRLRVGVAAGEFQVLHVGNNSAMEMVMSGPAIEAAKKCEGSAESGQVVADKDTWEWASSKGVVIGKQGNVVNGALRSSNNMTTSRGGVPNGLSNRRTSAIPSRPPGLIASGSWAMAASSTSVHRKSIAQNSDFSGKVTATQNVLISRRRSIVDRLVTMIRPASSRSSLSNEKSSGAVFSYLAPTLPELGTGRRSRDANALDDSVMRRYVPKPVLTALDANQGDMWVSHLRIVTVVFIKIDRKLDFTDEETPRLLQGAFETVYQTTTALEGQVNKFVCFDKGPTFLVAFGLPPHKHENDAFRGLVAAAGIQRALLLQGLPSSIGVTTGRVFCGVLGSSLRREYTVIGDSVNLSARLMVAGDGHILCDKDTQEKSRMPGLERKPGVRVKGKRDEIEAYVMHSNNETAMNAFPATDDPNRANRSVRPSLAVAEDDMSALNSITGRRISMLSSSSVESMMSRLNLEHIPVRKSTVSGKHPILLSGIESSQRAALPQVSSVEGDSRKGGVQSVLVGRTEELLTIERSLEYFLNEKTAPVVVIEGGPGVGKTAMAVHLREYMRRLPSHFGVHILQGHGSSMNRRSSHYLVRAVLKNHFRAIGKRSVPDQQAYVRELISGQPQLIDSIPLLNDVVNLQIPPTEVSSCLAGAARADKTLGLLLALLGAIGERHPTILFVEDAHWLDPTSWQLLARAVQELKSVMMVIVSRPGPWTKSGALTVVRSVASMGSEARVNASVSAGAGAMNTANAANSAALAAAVHDETRRVSSDEDDPAARMCAGQILESERLIRISLGPLQPADTIMLIARRLGVDAEEVPEAVLDFVMTRGEGHPLFTEELLQALRAAKVISVANGRCILNADISSNSSLHSELPTTIEGLLTSRIDQLDPAASLALKCAAVIGREFHLSMLQAIIPNYTSMDELRGFMAAFETLDLVHPSSESPMVSGSVQAAGVGTGGPQFTGRSHANSSSSGGATTNSQRTTVTNSFKSIIDSRKAIASVAEEGSNLTQIGELSPHAPDDVVEEDEAKRVSKSNVPEVYLFKHEMLRETAYNLLLQAQRKLLHRSAAVFLETHTTQQSQALHAIAAFHWIQAEMKRNALPHLLEACELATRKHACVEAIIFIKDAEAIIEEDVQLREKRPLKANLRHKLAVLSLNMGRVKESLDYHVEAARLLDGFPNTRFARRSSCVFEMARLLLRWRPWSDPILFGKTRDGLPTKVDRSGASTSETSGSLIPFERHGTKARATRRELRLRLDVYTTFTMAAYYASRSDTFSLSVLRSVNIIRKLKVTDPHSIAVYSMASLMFQLMGWDSLAERYLSVAQKASASMGNGSQIALVHFICAVVVFNMTRHRDCNDICERGLAVADAIDDRFRQVELLYVNTAALLHLAEYTVAREKYARLKATAETSMDGQFVYYCNCLEVELRYQMPGGRDHAITLFEHLLTDSLFHSDDWDRFGKKCVYAQLARAYALTGKYSRAREMLVRADGLVPNMKARHFLAMYAFRALAEAWLIMGLAHPGDVAVAKSLKDSFARFGDACKRFKAAQPRLLHYEGLRQYGKGNKSAALSHLRRAASSARALSMPFEEGWALMHAEYIRAGGSNQAATGTSSASLTATPNRRGKNNKVHPAAVGRTPTIEELRDSVWKSLFGSRDKHALQSTAPKHMRIMAATGCEYHNLLETHTHAAVAST